MPEVRYFPKIVNCEILVLYFENANLFPIQVPADTQLLVSHGKARDFDHKIQHQQEEDSLHLVRSPPVWVF